MRKEVWVTPEPTTRKLRGSPRLEGREPVRIEGEVRQQLLDLQVGEVRFDETMADWTAFGCGGPADALVLVDDVQGWGRLLSWCREHKVPVATVGQGRGMAVRSGGFHGVVVVTALHGRVDRADQRADLSLPDVVRDEDLVVEAGVRMIDLGSILTAHGAELNVSDVGTLGGTVRRCWLALREQVTAVGVLGDRGKIRWRVAEDVNADIFPVKQRQAIALVVFRPATLPSASLFSGSAASTMDDCRNVPDWVDGKLRIFLDTADTAASDVLDVLGVRGIRLRNVAIDEVDPNVAVNLGGGTVQDLGLLAKYLAERAEKEAGTELGQAYKVSGKKRQP